MNLPALQRRLGMPLAMQMVAILVCVLVAAQVVTLALTVLLPPEPTARWNMDEVAAALRGGGEMPARLERKAMSGPPDVRGQGWLVSESSRRALAQRLGRPSGEVVLAFYTLLPVGGVAVPTGTRSPLAAADAATEGAADKGVTLGLASLLVGQAHAQGAPPGGGARPGGMPAGRPGGLPGGGFPSGGFPGGRLPGGSLPDGGLPDGTTSGERFPNGGIDQFPSSQMPGNGASLPRPSTSQGGREPGSASGLPGSRPGAGLGSGTGRPTRPGNGVTPRPGDAARPVWIRPPTVSVLPMPVQTATPSPLSLEPLLPRPQPSEAAAPAIIDPAPVPAVTEPLPVAAPGDVPGAAPAQFRAPGATAMPQPIPFRRERASLFEAATPPFIEGDFVAAVRRVDGTWLAVAPRAEPFPNAWQARVMLWFALSLAIVSPLAWLFVRRIVVPLRDFARAAEQLGRDPSATILPLSGPAEIGRAANAFNQMRNRLRAFVDDRTAMVGAISHDLRTPLTRLRFRIEGVPDKDREGLLKEVAEMETMIAQVIAFIRDASTPGVRERVDFADLVAGSVADAQLVGAHVEIERNAHIPVEVDPMGIRRLLGNLLENAVKYGESARVRVSLADGEAVAEIVDAGPGIPDDEIDRAFEPFYRSVDARKSGRKGSGLGLAVCRSIARAHGGDVAFLRGEDGFTARVTVPAAYASAA